MKRVKPFFLNNQTGLLSFQNREQIARMCHYSWRSSRVTFIDCNMITTKVSPLLSQLQLATIQKRDAIDLKHEMILILWKDNTVFYTKISKSIYFQNFRVDRCVCLGFGVGFVLRIEFFLQLLMFFSSGSSDNVAILFTHFYDFWGICIACGNLRFA